MKNKLLIILFIILNISSVYAEIIFQDNFDGRTWTGSYASSQITGGTESSPGAGIPEPWTGYIMEHPTDLEAEIITTGGESGGYARFKQDVETQSDQVGIALYLPGIKSGTQAGDPDRFTWNEEGYDDFYVSFHFSVPTTNDYSTAGTGYFHKSLRFWQNVTMNRILGNAAEGDEPDQGISSEENTGYVVVTWKEWHTSTPWDPYPLFTMCDDFTGNSASGDRWWTESSGYVENQTAHFQNLFNYTPSTGTVNAQSWVHVEIRVKYASAWDATDGIKEVWVDDVKMDDNDFYGYNNTPTGELTLPHTANMPTPKLGGGFNYLVLNDNSNIVGVDSVPHWYYYDNLVVSTHRVGPDYVITTNGYQNLNGTTSTSTTISATGTPTTYNQGGTVTMVGGG